MDVEPVLPIGAELGEGPVWAREALWFVDIKCKRAYRFDPATAWLKHWNAPDQIGWVLPERSGVMVAGLKSGIARFDPAIGRFEQLFDPEPDRSSNRLNDAATAPNGQIWFGTMDDWETRPTGGLYRLGARECVDSGLPRVVITNGPAISADGHILYHTDTLGKAIWRVSINDDGSLGPPQRHIVIESGSGCPDGSVVDVEGCLWVALFGGWGVRQYAPDGALIRTIPFPVANVTKIAFGGPDLRTAYATTARKGLDADALAAQPQAGHLFAFDPGVRGLTTPEADLRGWLTRHAR